MIQLSNQLRDSSTAHNTRTCRCSSVAAAAPVPVPVPAAAALLESDYSQRRIKFTDHANEVISVLDMIGYPRVPTRGLLGFVIAKG